MRTRFLSASLLLVLLVATACRDGEPSGEPTPTMPPSSSTTPTVEPEPWEVQSRAGVKAFLKRYVEIQSSAFITGDTTAFRELATKCDGCESVADQIDEVYEAGGHIESEPDQFTGFSIDENGLQGGAECVVVFESSPTTWVRRPGEKPATYPGGELQKLVNLEWTGDAWTIVGLFDIPT